MLFDRLRHRASAEFATTSTKPQTKRAIRFIVKNPIRYVKTKAKTNDFVHVPLHDVTPFSWAPGNWFLAIGFRETGSLNRE
jgi:hypothetical protein